MPAISSTTLADLVLRARQTAEMENSAFVSDTEIKRRLLLALQRVRERLLAAGQEVERSTLLFNTVPGQSVYDLPPDFHRFVTVMASSSPAVVGPRNVLALPTAALWSTLDPFEPPEMAALLSRPISYAADMQYRMRGTSVTRQIEILPVPTGTWCVRVEYLTPIDTSNTSDILVIDGYCGYEEIAVLSAAIYCKTKEQSDTRELRADVAALWAEIDAIAEAADRGRPMRVVDTAGVLDDGGFCVGGQRWLP